MAWKIYDVTKDPFALGLVGLAEAIPSITVALYAGHAADVRSRKTIALWSLGDLRDYLSQRTGARLSRLGDGGHRGAVGAFAFICEFVGVEPFDPVNRVGFRPGSGRRDLWIRRSLDQRRGRKIDIWHRRVFNDRRFGSNGVRAAHADSATTRKIFRSAKRARRLAFRVLKPDRAERDRFGFIRGFVRRRDCVVTGFRARHFVRRPAHVGTFARRTGSGRRVDGLVARAQPDSPTRPVNVYLLQSQLLACV